MIKQLHWIFLGTLMIFPAWTDYISFTEEDLQQVAKPEILPLERSATLNGYGYVFFIPSPIVQDFVSQPDLEHKRLLEVGAGFSANAKACLEKGIQQYTVNDLEQQHLAVLASQLGGPIPDNLKFFCGRCPQDFPKLEETYHSILVDKVLHFLNPEEIQTFLKWSYEHLEEEGTLCILTIAPTIPSMAEVLPVYQMRAVAGEEFPGYFENIGSYVKLEKFSTTHPQYKLPPMMTFFALSDLVSLMKKFGFEVTKTYSLALPTVESPRWSEAQEDKSALVGVIAIKTKSHH
jgi:hypothetical protein